MKALRALWRRLVPPRPTPRYELLDHPCPVCGALLYVEPHTTSESVLLYCRNDCSLPWGSFLGDGAFVLSLLEGQVRTREVTS